MSKPDTITLDDLMAAIAIIPPRKWYMKSGGQIRTKVKPNSYNRESAACPACMLEAEVFGIRKHGISITPAIGHLTANYYSARNDRVIEEFIAIADNVEEVFDKKPYLRLYRRDLQKILGITF